MTVSQRPQELNSGEGSSREPRGLLEELSGRGSGQILPGKAPVRRVTSSQEASSEVATQGSEDHGEAGQGGRGMWVQEAGQ